MSDPRYKNIGPVEARIVEECGEVLQAYGKGMRFGWDNHHPKDTHKVTNREHFLAEIHDLMEACMDYLGQP